MFRRRRSKQARQPGAAFSQPPHTPASRTFEEPAMVARGVAALESGDRALALRAFWAARDTKDPDLLFVMGASLAAQGEVSEAERFLRRAAEMDHLDAMNNLGVLLKQSGQYAEAEHWLRRAAATGDRDALSNLGNLLRLTGRDEEAVERFRCAAEAGQPEAMISLGQALLFSGRTVEAERWLRSAGQAGHPAAELMLQVVKRTPKRPPGRESEPPAGGQAPRDPIQVDLGDPIRTAENLSFLADRSDDPRLLDLGLAAARAAVEAAPDGSGDRALALTTLCVLLRKHAYRSGEESSLREAVHVGRLAVETASHVGEYLPRCRSALACALMDGYQRRQDSRTLEEALTLNRQVAADTDLDEESYPGMLGNLSNTLLLQHLATGDVGVLDEAIVVSRDALHVAEPGSERYATVAFGLAQSLLGRIAVVFARDAGQGQLSPAVLDHLGEARNLAEQIREILPEGDPRLVAMGPFLDRLHELLKLSGQ